MALSRGDRLGSYEIRSVIGSGSMGVVYRARDTRLGRNVAIKLLNARTVARGAVYLQRFELEAKTAGSLNHPNLVTVHEFGTHDGAPFFVTDFLEGETLSSRLSRGPIRAHKAVDYTIQIARALVAVHDKGILHRDLKPDNIFITRDERVKILDFGVAKLIDPEARSQMLGLDKSLTAPGIVLGTARYVSPEQARDLPLDHRSDLFSVGLLLHEMLTGMPAYSGSPVEVMTAIVKQDPPDLVYPGEQLPGLDAVVRHCLEKSPERRVHSARDLIFQLESVAGVVEASDQLPAPKPRRRPYALLALALLPLGAFFAGHKAAATVPPVFHKLTYQRGLVGAARFAPDGETVVYSANWDASGHWRLFTTRPESPEARALGLTDAKILSVSRSGELAVQLGQPIGTLARAPIGGGAPRELIESVYEADWAPDGNSLAVVRAVNGKLRLEYPAGTVVYEPRAWVSGVRVSPSGDEVAFIDHPFNGYTRGTVRVVDRKGKSRALSRDWLNAMGLAWSPAGTEVFFTAGNVSGETAVRAVDLRGHERLVLPSTGNLTLQDVSASGRMLLSQTSLRWALMAGKGSSPPRDLSWMDSSMLADVSADAVLFLETGVANRNGGSGIYLRKLDGSPAVKLGEGSVSRLSPDGKWVLAAPGGEFAKELQLLPTGSGETLKVPLAELTLTGDPIFFPDGKRLLLRAREGSGKDRLFALELPKGAPRPVTREGLFDNALVSPDGTQLVAADEKGVLYLQRVDGGEAVRVRGAQAGEQAAGFDGASVYLLRQKPPSIARVSLATGAREPWKDLLQPDPAGAGRILFARVTPDGSAWAYNYDISLSDLYAVEGAQ